VLELNPNFVRSMEPLAACLAQSEQYDEAERVLRRLLEIQPNETQALMTMGKLLSHRTRYPEAASAFRGVLEKKPGHEEARRLLAYALRKGGQLKEARAVYDEMLRDNPKDFRARLGLAETLYGLGENHAAADEYQKMIEDWDSTAGVTQADVAGRIESLRRLPATERRDPRIKSPHEWVEILLNSTEPERCREAIKVLSTFPGYEEEVYKAFLKALKNKDSQVRVLALRELAKRWEGLIQELTPLLSLFVVDDQDRLVRAWAARILGAGGDPAAVPALVKALKDRDPYVFREVYDALWRLTTSEMSPKLPDDLTPEVMDGAAQGWQRWYDQNRDRYRKFERAGK
jgi:tetratricopeptide (TPR) repeat protein